MPIDNPPFTWYYFARLTKHIEKRYDPMLEYVERKGTASNKWDGNIAQSFAGGSGTSADPYIIETGGQLLLMKKT